MLGFSRATDLALLILTALARSQRRGPWPRRGGPPPYQSVRKLAREKHLPYRFAAQIVGALTRAGILEAKEGLRGGYRLARVPGAITVAEVIEATEGGVSLTHCLDPRRHGRCPQKAWCTARAGVTVLQQKLRATLRGMTIADLLAAPEP